LLKLSPELDYQKSLTEFCQSLENGRHAIYANSILGNHRQALRKIFPVVADLLNEKNFAALAHVYTQHFPATHWDINLYGDQFAQFLSAQVNSTKSVDFNWAVLSRLASIEYTITQCYFAKAKSLYTFNLGASAVNFKPDTVHLLSEKHPYIRFHENCQLEDALVLSQDNYLVLIKNANH